MSISTTRAISKDNQCAIEICPLLNISAVPFNPPVAERSSRMPIPILATTRFSSLTRWGIGWRRLHGISSLRAAAYWKDHGP